MRIGLGPNSCTYEPVHGKAMASRQERADVAQAAKALRLLVSLPAAAVAVAWEALPAQGKIQLQEVCLGDSCVEDVAWAAAPPPTAPLLFGASSRVPRRFRGEGRCRRPCINAAQRGHFCGRWLFMFARAAILSMSALSAVATPSCCT